MDAAAVHEHSPAGEWVADIDSLRGAAKRLAKSGEMRIGELGGGAAGDAKVVMCDWSVKLGWLCFHKTMRASAPMRAVAPDRYLMRYEGRTHEMKVGRMGGVDKLETFDVYDPVNSRVTWSRKAAVGVLLTRAEPVEAGAVKEDKV